MSESSNSAAAPAQAPQRRRFSTREISFGVLLVLSIAGIAVSDFSADWGLGYWLAMVPLFAAASVYSGWPHARGPGRSRTSLLLKLLLHWGVLAVVDWVIYLFERTGRLDPEDAGLMALLSLALATILAGVHFDWRLGVLGGLLYLGAACAALVDEFFWILLVPAVLAGAAVLVWQHRSEKPKDRQSAA